MFVVLALALVVSGGEFFLERISVVCQWLAGSQSSIDAPDLPRLIGFVGHAGQPGDEQQAQYDVFCFQAVFHECTLRFLTMNNNKQTPSASSIRSRV